MSITIRQIAKEAGVSRGTVDRVLNGRPGVKPEVRERIMSIANQLNYSPNVAAKALAYRKNPVLLGIVMPPRDIQFFEEIRKGIYEAEEELKGLGIRLEYRYVDNVTPDEGAAAVRDLAEAGANGILFSLMDDPAIRESIDFAVEQGIPVVTFNSDVENSRRICFVGQDLRKSGKVAAGLIGRSITGAARVLAVTGNMKFHAHRSRIEGFREGLSAMGGAIRISDVIESFDRYADTFDKLDRMFEEDPGISGIFMATGDIQACLDVLRKHGKERTVRVVCNDLVPASVQGMREGIIDFTIVQNPKQQGYRSLRILFDIVFFGKRPESEYFYTETHIYVPESL